MRICILAENGSSHIQKWVNGLQSVEGNELHIICFKRGLEFKGVQYYPLKKYTGTKLDYILNVPRVRKFVKLIKPDVLHSHYATSYGLLGALTRFKPYIVTGWGADIFDSPKNAGMRAMLKWIFKQADAITLLSEVTKREIKKLTSKEIKLIPFGVDLTRFKPNLSKQDDGIVRIGTIRTLSGKYGVEYLIRAFAQIYGMGHKNIELHIIGDGPLKEHLQNLAIELGVENQVQFYGYINQNQDFERYISILDNLDIFAILSILDSETFGVAAVEASACAIPVVATNVGGLPEVIDHEKTGIIVNPKDVNNTSKALEQLVKSRELREQLGYNGLAKVKRCYDWNTNILQMNQLYKSLQNRNPYA